MIKIKLHGVNGEGKYALIDDEDFDKVKDYRWFCHYSKTSSNFSVICNKRLSKLKYATVQMHHIILEKKEGFVIDHIDGDRFNNQKSNLRYCNRAENSLNKRTYKNNLLGIKGVSFKNGKWIARITKSNKTINLGKFDTPEDAEKAYIEESKKLFGEFRRENPLQTVIIPKKNIKKEPIHPPTDSGSSSIYLSKGKFAIIDEKDLEAVSKYKWCLKESDGCMYAIRHEKRDINGKRKTIRLHNYIMNPPEGMVVDHINNDGLDNRRVNLRVVSPTVNYHNRRYKKSINPFKGVYINKKGKYIGYVAVIGYKGKKIHLGRFPFTEEGKLQAKSAYEKAYKNLIT